MTKTITYELIEVEQEIDLPTATTGVDVPYCFKGTNHNDHSVKIRPVAACGCTTTGGEFTVPPHTTFEVKGLYKKSERKGLYTKKVNLWFGHNDELTNSEDRKITCSFNGRIN